MVLMYHRVADPESDIWEVAINSSNFAQHLQILKKTADVIPLKELIRRIKHKSLSNNSVALTFDDGYIDNYLIAKPLLEKYQLPATFFISSGNVGKEEEYWWDELENLILYVDKLPPFLSITIGDKLVMFNLNNEAHLDTYQLRINRGWKACMEVPPSLRCQLYLTIWQLLTPLTYAGQQLSLEKLRNWAKVKRVTRPSYQSLSVTQLQDLGKHELINIGAHTVSHAALACHDFIYQKSELQKNKEYLRAVTGKEIIHLAYPYGNYNQESTTAALETDFKAAFTTEEKVVTKQSQIYRIGRFQVKNLNSKEFGNKLEEWKRIRNDI